MVNGPLAVVWVQRPRGKRFDPNYLVERIPHSERVSLWGCFCARGVGQAEIFVGEFDAKRYVDILQHNLIQTAMHFYPREHWWFQQDNAPQHTSHLAQRWFHNHGVDLLDFPPYSPDLNPIENLWSILKARVEARLARTTDEVEFSKRNGKRWTKNCSLAWRIACLRAALQLSPITVIKPLIDFDPRDFCQKVRLFSFDGACDDRRERQHKPRSEDKEKRKREKREGKERKN